MQSSTYSFKDVSGGMSSVNGPFSFAGQIGVGEFIINMHTEQSVLDTAADGLIMPSALAGQSGAMTIQVQQTSALHRYLLAWYNLLKQARDNGDVSQWFGAAVSLVSKTDGSSHQLTGVAPTKIPDKTYGPQGVRLSWQLLACNIENQ
jgi:hypothetical protein